MSVSYYETDISVKQLSVNNLWNFCEKIVSTESLIVDIL